MSSGANQPVTLVDVKKGLDALAAEVEQGYEYARRIHAILSGPEPKPAPESSMPKLPIAATGVITGLYTEVTAITRRLLDANDKHGKSLNVLDSERGSGY